MRLALLLLLTVLFSLAGLGCGDGGKAKHSANSRKEGPGYKDVPRPAEKPE